MRQNRLMIAYAAVLVVSMGASGCGDDGEGGGEGPGPCDVADTGCEEQGLRCGAGGHVEMCALDGGGCWAVSVVESCGAGGCGMGGDGQPVCLDGLGDAVDGGPEPDGVLQDGGEADGAADSGGADAIDGEPGDGEGGDGGGAGDVQNDTGHGATDAGEIDAADAELACDASESACTSVGTFCDGAWVRECAVGPDGCLVSTPLVDCADQAQSCVESAAGAECTSDTVIGEYTFHLIADLDTPNPAPLGGFTMLEQQPVLGADGSVVFRASSNPPVIPKQSTQGNAVYRWTPDGIIEVLAMKNDSIPGGQGGFVTFDPLVINPPSVAGERVAFIANGEQLQRGVYLHDGEGVVRVVDKTSAIPAGTGTFQGIGEPMATAIDGFRVLFAGNDFGSQAGIYRWEEGELAMVINLETPIPNGTGAFTGLGVADLNGALVSILGYGPPPVGATFSGTQSALYHVEIGSDQPPLVLVDKSTPLPDQNDSFFIMTGALEYALGTVFHGRGSPGPLGPFGTQIYKGLFRRASDGEISVIVDTFMTMPGSVETFSYDFANGLTSQYVCVDGDTVVFRGVGTTGDEQTQIGLYRADASGELSRIVDLSDLIQGKSPIDILTGRYCARDGKIAMFVEFHDGSMGIYLATKNAP